MIAAHAPTRVTSCDVLRGVGVRGTLLVHLQPCWLVSGRRPSFVRTSATAGGV